jgi:hypothetical protein
MLVPVVFESLAPTCFTNVIAAEASDPNTREHRDDRQQHDTASHLPSPERGPNPSSASHPDVNGRLPYRLVARVP